MRPLLVTAAWALFARALSRHSTAAPSDVLGRHGGKHGPVHKRHIERDPRRAGLVKRCFVPAESCAPECNAGLFGGLTSGNIIIDQPVADWPFPQAAAQHRCRETAAAAWGGPCWPCSHPTFIPIKVGTRPAVMQRLAGPAAGSQKPSSPAWAGRAGNPAPCRTTAPAAARVAARFPPLPRSRRD